MSISRRKKRHLLLGVLATGILLIPAACGGSHHVRTAATSTPAAEASTASPASSSEVTINAHDGNTAGTPDAALSQAPSLGGISLGMTLADAEAKIGDSADDRYTLPEAGRAVEVREYGGLTLGVDTSGHVVYVEISSASIVSGLPNVEVGSSSSDAARSLSLKTVPSSSSMTADVEGGILRLDLDPVSDEVVTIKLIGSTLV